MYFNFWHQGYNVTISKTKTNKDEILPSNM